MRLPLLCGYPVALKYKNYSKVFIRSNRNVLFKTLLKINRRTQFVPYITLFVCFFNLSRFPSLFPLLKPDFVAKELVNGMLRDEGYVILPKTMTLTMMLQWWVVLFNLLFLQILLSLILR